MSSPIPLIESLFHDQYGPKAFCRVYDHAVCVFANGGAWVQDMETEGEEDTSLHLRLFHESGRRICLTNDEIILFYCLIIRICENFGTLDNEKELQEAYDEAHSLFKSSLKLIIGDKIFDKWYELVCQEE